MKIGSERDSVPCYLLVLFGGKGCDRTESLSGRREADVSTLTQVYSLLTKGNKSSEKH